VTLRCLFLGLGGVGQRHLRNLRTLRGRDVEIWAYRVRGESHVIGDRLEIQKGEDVETKYDVKVVKDVDRAFDARPDVVFVTNPTSLHLLLALRAAEEGCHLLIEKPLSHSLEGVGDLIRIVEEKKLIAFVAYQLRQHPGFIRLREILKSGMLGQVLSVSAEVGEYLPGFHPYEDYRRMYASRRELGGGVTLTQIHEIDYLYALFGMPEKVYSLGGHLSSLAVDVEDVAVSILAARRSDGKLLPIELHQDYVQRPPARRCRVIGETGRVDWSLSSAELVRWTAGQAVETHDYRALERNQLFLDELRHFLQCVETGERPEVDLRDGAKSLAIGLALRESQQTGLPASPDLAFSAITEAA
jgi:predicted dehydrogenase